MSAEFHPLVSIVIPVYNGANYLREAIDSALAQTYNNIEVIVVNDGSNDNGATEAICLSYGDKIRYFKKENGGVASALNMGIKNMRGEYFSWLSHDDVYTKNNIEIKIFNYKEHLISLDILFSDYYVCSEDLKILYTVNLDGDLIKLKPLYAVLLGMINGCTVLINKKCFDTVGLFNLYKTTQDYDMWLRLARNFNFVHVKETLTYSRQHINQGSLTSEARREADEFWIKTLSSLSVNEVHSLEKTDEEFYLRMLKFFADKPYYKAYNFCKSKTTIQFRMKNMLIRRLSQFYKAIKKLTSYKYLINHIKTKDINIEKNIILSICNIEEKKYDKNYNISVIIPTFNRGYSLPVALSSVLNQTYKNFEIIIVDDNSSDWTQEICSHYKKLYNNIKVIKNSKNLGVSASRNIGIHEAKGKFITFLDSDDYYSNNKLQYQIDALRKNKDYSFCTSFFCINNLSNSSSHIQSFSLNEILYPNMLLASKATITTPSVMVRSEILQQSGHFDENLSICEDLDLWARILMLGKPLLVKKPLVFINTRGTSHYSVYEALKARDKLYMNAFYWDKHLPEDFKIKLYIDLLSIFYKKDNPIFDGLCKQFSCFDNFYKVYQKNISKHFNKIY